MSPFGVKPTGVTADTYGEPGRFLYHYTTSEAAFQHIVPVRELRLSPLAQLRDPVENKIWVQALRPSLAWTTDDIAQFERLAERVIHETKILSFTLDDPSSGKPPEHARGYARPRMWEQYGGNHRGVCLVFDHETMQHTLTEGLAGRGRVIADEVIYRDSPLKGHERARSPDAGDIAMNGGGGEGLRAHMALHVKELFFRKLTDWATEREFRYVVLDRNDAVIRVDYGKALRAVVLGEKFADWQIPGVVSLCEAAKADLIQIQWRPLRPIVVNPLIQRR